MSNSEELQAQFLFNLFLKIIEDSPADFSDLVSHLEVTEIDLAKVVTGD